MRSILSIIDAASRNFGQQWHSDLAFHPSSSFHQWKRMTKRSGIWGGWGRSFRQGFFEVQISVWPEVELNVLLLDVGSTGGFARNFNIWGGVGWGGDDTVPCNCPHLAATQLMFLSCTCTHLDATQLMFSCTCTHLDATQLMFLALAHIWVLRNWCFLHLHTSRYYATDVSCTCTHLGATQLMFLALAHISMLRNWCFLHVHKIWVLRNWCSLHLHTSRRYATDVLCNCTHLGARQLMFLALAHISMLRNWNFSATGCTKSNSTKQHAWQIVSNGYAVNYRWLLIFPPDLAKKTDVWTLSKNIQWSIASENMICSLLLKKTHFIWKNTVKSTPWLQEQQTAADTHHM